MIAEFTAGPGYVNVARSGQPPEVVTAEEIGASPEVVPLRIATAVAFGAGGLALYGLATNRDRLLVVGTVGLVATAIVWRGLIGKFLARWGR